MKQKYDQTARLRHLQQTIRVRKGLIGCGRGFSVALHNNGRILYAGTDRRGQGEAETWTGIMSIFAEGDSVIALMSDGTIRPSGRSEAEMAFAETLSCVRRVDAGTEHIAALLGSGRVVIGGRCHRGHEEVNEWPAVTDICCGATYTAGLTEDGRVVMAGGSRVLRYIVSTWQDIVGIFADGEAEALYAINASGRLLCSTAMPGRAYKWHDLVFVAASAHRIRAVTASGQLLSTTPLPQQMSEDGRRYVACAVSETHGLALSIDGAVIANGKDDFSQCRTARFGRMFDNFEEYSVSRREQEHLLEETERDYQCRYAGATRFSGYLACSPRITACLTAQGRVLTSTAFGAGNAWNQIRALACGTAHILALRRDGRVLAEGNNVENCCTVSDWRDIRAVAAGSYHSVGLTVDGHVCFRGLNDMGQGDVTAWTGIRYLRTTDTYTVGVGYDGIITVAGTPPFDRARLEELPARPVDVAVASTHLVCLYADGRVYSTIPDVTESWRNIRAVVAGEGFTVGLGFGGAVRVARHEGSRLPAEAARAVADWRHAVAVVCGDTYIAALTADGRVLTFGEPITIRVSATEQMSTHAPTPAPVAAPLAAVSDWQDVVAIAGSTAHLLAVNRDGQVLAAGADSDGQCSSTTHFTLFRDGRYLGDYGRGRRYESEPLSPESAPALP